MELAAAPINVRLIPVPRKLAHKNQYLHRSLQDAVPGCGDLDPRWARPNVLMTSSMGQINSLIPQRDAAFEREFCTAMGMHRLRGK